MLTLNMRIIIAVVVISISAVYNANAQSLQLRIPTENEVKNVGNAKHCVKITRDNEQFVFTNICEYKIYVIYCGDLKYSNKKCGDGSNGAYYTHARNIAPYAKGLSITGKFNWGACFGGIGFVNNKNYQDYPDGRYTCLR